MKALLVVDVQNDFIPGGSLAVPNGDQIVSTINKLMDHFDLVVATQDWHPEKHGSFASVHDAEPFSEGELDGVEQIYWPDHCIQGSHGAKFHKDLDTDSFEAIFRKGTDPMIDSYSGFFDNKRQKKTGLHGYLQEREVDTVHVVGLAADVCVKFTALDAVDLGYETVLIEDATRALEAKEFAKFKAELGNKKGGMVMDSTAMLPNG